MKPLVMVIVLLMVFTPCQSFAQGTESLFGAGREQKEIKPSGRTYFVSPDKENKGSLDEEGEQFVPAESVDEPVTDKRKRIDQISKAAKYHAQNVISECIGNWEDQLCLRMVSDTYLTAAALYAEDLTNNGHKAEEASIKDHCAASTAATRLDDVPAYAMRSAFVECSNEFYSIYERTKIMADQELSQLMVMAVLCLDKDPRCSLMESGLKDSLSR